jgi:glycosyltransferase involved in cell wall biosynthesis
VSRRVFGPGAFPGAVRAVHTFSVVIATRNREALLAATLRAITSLDWPAYAYEVLIADNGSTDGTPTVVANSARKVGAPLIRYLFVQERGKSAAVNQALALATGDLIALTDDDVRPEPDWLARLNAAFDETGADFVAGRVRPAWEVPPPDWISPSVYGVLAVPDNGDERLEISANDHRVVPIGANMAVRRTVVQKLGGLRVDLGKLDGTLRTGEDHEFFLRMVHAGFRGVYEPAAVVHHRVGAERLDRNYFRQWLHQNGQDVARLHRTYPLSVRRLFRAPRYLWRQAADDSLAAIAATVKRDAARRFSAAGRLIWFAGYLREAWVGRAVSHEEGASSSYVQEAS